MSVQRQYFPSIEWLRIIAQWGVVASHCLFLADWGGHTWARDLAFPLFRNSAALFVLMSGFLFANQSSSFSYTQFWRKRFWAVVVPCLFAVSPLAFLWLVGHEFGPGYDSPWVMLLTGYNPYNRALWFFPMMIVLYVMSPVFVFLLKSPRLLLSITLLGLIGSFLVHRPAEVKQFHHTLLYFTPVYLLGMVHRLHEDKVRYWVSRYMALILCFLGLVLFYQWNRGSDMGTLRGFQALWSLGEVKWSRWDSSLMQKILIYVTLFYSIETWTRLFPKLNSVARVLAPSCFAIHLYHAYFITVIEKLSGPWGIHPMVTVLFGATVLFYLLHLMIVLIRKAAPQLGAILFAQDFK